MKTRRSKKSFEMVPPPSRRAQNRRRRKALNLVNETIVLSDSDTEEVQLVDDNDDDDIQVIDIAEVSDTILKDAIPSEVSDGISKATVPSEVSDAILKATVPSEVSDGISKATVPSEVSDAILKATVPSEVSDTNDTILKDTVPCDVKINPEIDLKSENVKMEPPVINIEDEPDQNDDDIEVLSILVTSKSRSSRNREKRLSLKRKSNGSNGNLSQMQESIKRAKHMVRRSSKNSDSVRGPLNKISANSRQIGKNNQRNNKFQGRNFQQRKRHGLFQNRTRELQRQVVFRPDYLLDQNDIFNAPSSSNYSFEVNPFLPANSSTPAYNRIIRNRNDDRAPWVPSRRAHNYNPPPIAPGSNIMNAGQVIERAKGTLRPIVIDGSNVAVGHGGVGGNREFSARGIRICVDYFKKRGHNEILVFVPRYRLKKSECRDPELLEEMEREGHVRFTPSREAGGQRIASYDDLFVVQYAHETGGIVISNDNFKDLYIKKQHLQDTITFRLLQYTWITQNVIMFPEDPLGRNGPSLDEFLRF